MDRYANDNSNQKHDSMSKQTNQDSTKISPSPTVQNTSKKHQIGEQEQKEIQKREVVANTETTINDSHKEGTTTEDETTDSVSTEVSGEQQKSQREK